MTPASLKEEILRYLDGDLNDAEERAWPRRSGETGTPKICWRS